MGLDGFRQAGGVVMDNSGNIYVGNYAFGIAGHTRHAYLSMYNPQLQSWQHLQHPTATSGGAFDSDLAIFGTRVAMSNYSYDLATSSWSQVPRQAFPDSRQPADLSPGIIIWYMGLSPAAPDN